MAVLLIGSTGNGKSTLGNFLLAPESQKPEGEYFRVSSSNLPQTQVTEYKTAMINLRNGQSQELTIIDTPGLNIGKVQDLQHMIHLIQALQKVKTVKACIFVVKFSSRIDQQYKDTIEYFAKL